MKDKILAGALAAAVLTGGGLYGQNVGVLGDPDHGNYSHVAPLRDWIDTNNNRGWNVTQYDLNSSNALSSAVIDDLNAFDLVIIPRQGFSGSTDNADDFNSLTVPILNTREFAGSNWGWFDGGGAATIWGSSGAESTSGSSSNWFTDILVDQPGHPIMSSFTPDQDGRLQVMGEEWTSTIRARTFDSSNGTTLAQFVEGDPNTGNDAPSGVPYIHIWDGDDSNEFYPSSTATMPDGTRRAWMPMVTWPGDPDDARSIEALTDDGTELFMTTAAYTIPEPGTYALFFGLAASGLVMFLRRRRRS